MPSATRASKKSRRAARVQAQALAQRLAVERARLRQLREEPQSDGAQQRLRPPEAEPELHDRVGRHLGALVARRRWGPPLIAYLRFLESLKSTGNLSTLPRRMFSKVLVANRGEIAIRVMRTLEELGVGTVAVYSEPDRDAPHVRRADEAYLLGPGPAAESYLVVEKIIEVAKQSGAEAIHPGYGFLAENAAFARACDEAGIVFIGPPGRRHRRHGLEDASARELMKDAGVPIVPGTTDPVESVEDAKKIIDADVGYPVAIKAAGGGGGKGFRVALSEDELADAFEGAAREGEKFFSDSTVYIERYLPDPRHVEVQVLADSHGNVVHLFERDCSVQRRHQKLIEESPAPAVDPELREKIGKIGTDAAKAVDYRGAGTIEGLLSDDGEYFFLEMNTRVQVEHCVTEMVTGIDIVREQIKRRRRRGAVVRPGGHRDPRARDRVPHQRRGRVEELRARARHDHVLRAAQRPRRARGLRRRGRLRGAAAVRPDDRQADRLGRGPRGVHQADAARAVRVRDRRPEDPDPVPLGAAGHRPVARGRDLPRPGGGQEVAQGSWPSRSPRSAADDEDEEPKVERDYAVEVSGRRFDVKVIGEALRAAAATAARPAARKPPKRSERTELSRRRPGPDHLAAPGQHVEGRR